MHLIGGAALVRANAPRLTVHPQARWVNLTKAVLTVAAVAASGYNRWLGQQLIDAEADGGAGATADGDDATAAGVPVDDEVTPSPSTPDELARTQRRLAVLQWLTPATTGALLVLNAKAGEQQRPAVIVRDLLRSRVPVRVRAAAPVARRVVPAVARRAVPAVAQRAVPDARTLPWTTLASGVAVVLALRWLVGTARRTRRQEVPTARDLMTADVDWVGRDETLQSVARRMAERDIGFMPVCEDDGRLLGVVTDRDIVTGAVASGASAAEYPAWQLVTRRPASVSPDARLDEVVHTMAEHAVRRLPVVDDGRLVGVISESDVATDRHATVAGALEQEISTAP
jgi:CBS domain-containing protein